MIIYLKSISSAQFGQDFADLRQSPTAPLECTIKIFPLIGYLNANEKSCSITIHIECGVQYPVSSPEIKILDCCDVDEQHKSQIVGALQNIINMHTGQEILYNLCVTVSEMLYECSKENKMQLIPAATSSSQFVFHKLEMFDGRFETFVCINSCATNVSTVYLPETHVPYTAYHLNLSKFFQSNYKYDRNQISKQLQSLKDYSLKITSEYLIPLVACGNLSDDYTLITITEKKPEYTFSHAKNIGHLSLEMLQKFSIQMFEALAFLHSDQILLGDIDCDDVSITPNNDIKLCKYGVLSSLSSASKTEILEYNVSLAQDDVKLCCKLLLALCSRNDNYISEVKLPSQFPESVIEFFSIGLYKANSAFEMLKHSFLKQNYSNFENPELSKYSTKDHSMFKEEFVKIGLLGRGGFGSVIKARKRVDGQIYAIKKIQLSKQNVELFSEVRILSKFNHENVVRYFHAWVESHTYLDENFSDSSDSWLESYDADENFGTFSEYTERFNKSMQLSKSVRISSSPKINDFDQTFNVMLAENANTICDNKSDDEIEEDIKFMKDVSIKKVLLYIQMELCEEFTLQKKIENDLFMNMELVWNYFKQILSGLNYIHSKDIVHRDLKPSNIFIGENYVIKIGDFGLAKTYNLEDDKSMSSSDTGNVGTFLYQAPELCCSQPSKCTPKMDVYSLGIIFFEMCSKNPSTGMERHKILSALRKDVVEFPRDFIYEKPNESKIISSCLNRNPLKRPQIMDLLQSDLIPKSSSSSFLQQFKEKICKFSREEYETAVLYFFNKLIEPISTKSFITTYHISNFRHQSRLHEILSSLFILHGASLFSTPDVDFCCGSSSPDFLDKRGRMFKLSNNLRTSFLSTLAHLYAVNFRRYNIGRVYNDLEYPSNMLFEIVYDVVGSKRTAEFINAEGLFVFEECLKRVAEEDLINNTTIYLNDMKLVRCILSHFEISNPDMVLNLLFSDQEKTFTKYDFQCLILPFLRNLIDLHYLYNFLSLKGSVSFIKDELKLITNSNSSNGSYAAKRLASLEQVNELFLKLGGSIKIELILSLGGTADNSIYNGIIFQAYAYSDSFQGVLAVGGTYSPRFLNATSPYHGFGFSLNFWKFLKIAYENKASFLNDYCLKSDKLFGVAYVGSSISSYYPFMIVCLRVLWELGKKSCLLTDEYEKEEKAIKDATAHLCHFLILFFDDSICFLNVSGDIHYRNSFESIVDVKDFLQGLINESAYL